MTVFLIFLATSAVTLLAFAFLGRYFHHAAIRAAERSAEKYSRATVCPVCGEERRAPPLADVRGGRLDSGTGKVERSN